MCQMSRFLQINHQLSTHCYNCECGVLLLNQTPANLGFPASLQTRFLVSSLPPPSLVAISLCCDSSRGFRDAVRSTWNTTQDARVRSKILVLASSYFCLQRRRYLDMTSLAARARHTIQSKPGSLTMSGSEAVSGTLTCLETVRVFIPSNSGDQGGGPGQPVFPGNHLTLTLLSILASLHLSFTASIATSVYNRTKLHVLAKYNCDPASGLREMRRVLWCLVW